MLLAIAILAVAQVEGPFRPRPAAAAREHGIAAGLDLLSGEPARGPLRRDDGEPGPLRRLAGKVRDAGGRLVENAGRYIGAPLEMLDLAWSAVWILRAAVAVASVYAAASLIRAWRGPRDE